MTSNETDIGLLNEKPLHAALKEWYAQQGDAFEVDVDGYVIDVVCGDLLVEIQTGSCSPLKDKLRSLVAQHPTRLVIPIAREKWLVKLPKEPDGKTRRRKSPKKGRAADLFGELVSFPDLMCQENFSLEVLLIQEEEVRSHQPGRRWRRRGWVTEERRLLTVLDRRLFSGPQDLLLLIDGDLPTQFTTADLAKAMNTPRRVAQQAAYCLRHMNAITKIGKRGNAYLYRM